MNISDVLAKFAILSGLSGSGLNRWESICEDSILEIRSKLRDGVIEEDHDRILCAAAAALSFYKYVLLAVIGNDIDPENAYILSSNFIKSLASTIWLEYKQLIANLIVDEKFVFKGII